MVEVLWHLLQEEPSTLSCDECFAVMEYYAEILVQGGEALLPQIMKHLEGCPSCRTEHRSALQQLVRTKEEGTLPAIASTRTPTQKGSGKK